MHTFSVSQEPLAADKIEVSAHDKKLAELKTKLQKKYKTIFEDPFAEEVWAATYKDHSDDTVDDTMFRVAAAAASMEKTEELKLEWTENFYDLLSNFKATAGGRIYANAGTEFKGTTLMNCFVGPRVKYDTDSLDGILTHLRSQAHTLKSEGGWGENFSYIRPRGAFIHGIGVETPGAVKYMELFDKSSEIITSGSGKKSLNKKAKGKIRKGAMMGVMDCISGDTLIHTTEGKIAIRNLVGKNPLVYCTDGNGTVYVRKANKVWSKGQRKTIKVIFDNDDFIECTPDHKFLLSTGDYKKAKDLNHGDSIAALNKRLLNQYVHLSITGSRKVIAEHNAIYEMKYGEHPTVMGKTGRTNQSTVAHHIDHNKLNNSPENIQMMTLGEHSKHHSELLKEYQLARASKMKGKTWEQFYGKQKANEIKTKYTSKRVGSVPWNKGMKFSTADTNHKILKVEQSITQEVFDMSVPDFHNFVANGVFIHNCWHPDIIEFITAKQQPGRLTKFNVSVNCTDEFMGRITKILELKKKLPWFTGEFSKEQLAEFKPVQDEIDELDKWHLRFPDTSFEKYKEEWDGNMRAWEAKGYPVKVYQTISAQWLWNLIMESTYNRAEPGVLFLDRANYFLPLNYAETVFATNPCGEQTLAPGGVCNLASLNLTQFVDIVKGTFDLKKVAKYTRFIVRFLDNINDLTNAPLPEYEYSIRNKRRIGVGILGWGSALYMLKTRFASEQANKIRDDVMQTIARTAYMASIDLAEEKGMFSVCEPKWHSLGPFIKSLNLPEEYMGKLMKYGIRNSSLLSIQPTGNTSIYANVVSGGLEPVFLHEYVRTVIVNTMPDYIADVTPKWYEGAWHETSMFKLAKEGDEEILKGKAPDGMVYKIDKNRGLTKEVLCEDYGVRHMKQIGEWDPSADWAATALGMNVNDHVSDLKGFAKFVDSAMSKTVNVPNDYSFEKFKDIYLDAFNSGYVKGVTTYRSGTMTTVLAAKEEKNAEPEDEEIIRDDVKMPDSAPATVKTLKAEGKKWYMTVVWNETQTRPFALFVQTNAHEKNVVAEDAVDHLITLARRKKIPKRHIDSVLEKISSDNNSTKIARMISLCLRHGILIKNIVATLDKTEAAYAGSFVFAVKKWLSTFIKDGEKVEGACLECGSNQVVFREGCSVCLACGSSKCG